MPPRLKRKLRCANCRRKKIKCDYQRPQCSQCLRSHLQCQQDVQELVFVVHHNQARSAGSSVWLDDCLPTARDLSHCPFLQPSFTRVSLYDQFLEHYLPRLSTSQSHSCMWATRVRECQHRSRPVDAAACALGTLMMARVNCDAHFEAHSMQLYGLALRELRREIMLLPARKDWYKFLVASMFLQLYELMDSSMRGWAGVVSHGIGVSSIMQRLGPTTFQSPVRHQAFLFSRSLMVISSVLQETPSFLGTPQWLCTPWETIQKDIFHSLLDIFAQLPHLLYLVNCIQAGGVDDQLLTQIERTHDHVSNMFDMWYSDLKHQTHNELFDLLSAVTDKSDMTQPIIATSFAELELALMLLLYWTGRILLYDAARRVFTEKRFSRAPVLSSCLDLPAVFDMAKKILRTVPLCLNTQNGIFGLKFTLLPLRTLERLYKHCGVNDYERNFLNLVKELEIRGFSI